MAGTPRNDLTRPTDNPYARMTMEVAGDSLTPALAGEIRQFARRAMNYKVKLTPDKQTELKHARFVLYIQGRRLFGQPTSGLWRAVEDIEQPRV